MFSENIFFRRSVFLKRRQLHSFENTTVTIKWPLLSKIKYYEKLHDDESSLTIDVYNNKTDIEKPIIIMHLCWVGLV